ncbi:MAG: hypothetical protein HY081_02930 [Gammaproteobacteria bacterium]|nr:hypothetical protein [Gammaproteobacteria bacterium]
MFKIKIIYVLLLATLLPACITTYRDFPENMVNNPPKTKPFGTLFYNIKPVSVLTSGGGEEALQTVFRQKTPFANTEKTDKIPSRGIYCSVEVLYKPPTLPALVFGYISASTLTILPVWSEHDGYRATYEVFINGEKKKSYEYDITRKGGAWILLLPFAWINFLTYSEKDAFEATTYQFFKDSEPLFAGYKDTK